PGRADQGLVVFERLQGAHDRLVAVPVPRRLARTAVDDEVLGTFGDVRVEVVHQHPEGGLLDPAFALPLRAARRPDRPHAQPSRKWPAISTSACIRISPARREVRPSMSNAGLTSLISITR